MHDFDSVYDQKMKNGKYQFGLVIVGAILNLIDGSYFTIFPFCVRFIQLDYALTNSQASVLSSVMLAGSIIAGPIAGYTLGRLGRKMTITGSATLGVLIGVFFFYSNTFLTIVLSTTLLGMYMVSIIASLMLYLVETITGGNKGKVIVAVYSFFSIGRLYGTISARFTLSPYEYDYWKIPICINCMILILAYFIIVFLLKESVKYSYHKGDKQNAVNDFNEIQRINHSEGYLITHDLLMTNQDLRNLSTLRRVKLEQSTSAASATHGGLYYLLQTFVFMFSIIFSLYFNILHTMIVPNIMGTDSSSLTSNILIMSGELLGVVIMMTCIENKHMGRKRIIVLGHIMMAATFLAYAFVPTLPITIVMYVSKIFLKCSLSTSFIHLNESFPIHVRAKAVMAVTTIVNTSSIGAPFLFFAALNHGVPAVFFSAGLIAFLGLLTDIFMVSDLDKKEENLSKLEDDDDENLNTALAEQKLS